jgi:NitT/TauT family transport system ATP-binding protein
MQGHKKIQGGNGFGTEMAHIEIRDVSLVYDTPAGQVTGVDKASFSIEQSEFLCIVGPSGCGKSTLLNIIAGFLPPTGGEIKIAGKAVSGYGQDRGVVFRGARRSATSPSGSR